MAELETQQTQEVVSTTNNLPADFLDSTPEPSKPETQAPQYNDESFKQWADQFQTYFGVPIQDFVGAVKTMQESYPAVYTDYSQRYDNNIKSELSKQWQLEGEQFTSAYGEVEEAFNKLTPEKQNQLLALGEASNPGNAGIGVANMLRELLTKNKTQQQVPELDRSSGSTTNTKPKYNRSDLRNPFYLKANEISNEMIELAYAEGRVINDI